MPENRRRGFSLIELLVVIAIILIILAIAVPNMEEARKNAAEVAVIREVQTIGTAQVQYQSQFGKFAASLAELGPQAAHLIPASLASGEKDGYLFTLTATPAGYAINANPKVFKSTGRRTFYSDQTMAIHQNWSQEPANAGSPQLP